MAAPTVLDFCHDLLRRVVYHGAVAVDATLGNGHDAAFLARAAGPGGRVYGFDIQAAAIRSSRSRLQAQDLADRVVLIEAGHETMRETLPAEVVGRVAAVTFNLGFLPGSDGEVITRPETTLAALACALDVLDSCGALSIVTYAGHPGGAEEAAAVAEWCAGLDYRLWRATSYHVTNKPAARVALHFVERSGR